jgi:hypothetical protein
MCVTEPGGQIIAPFNPKAQSGPGACNTCATYTSYMTRYGYWTPGDPLEDGDVGGHPGMWINMEGARLAGLTRKSDCAKVSPGNGAAGLPCSACDPPVMEERLTACPTPHPTPSATPPAGPTPTPQAGEVACTPHSHTGVALHNTVPAPNGPRKIAWRFSATNKSVKPFCPEHRNECESQGYIGDPVNNYDAVVWRFDERFRCQALQGPPDWSQQEPHTGSNWERTDVNHQNPWLANLKPAVPGLHTVRVCVRGTDNCRTTTAVAP